MREKFREAKLSKNNLERLQLINSIIREYQQQGLILTLRQLYYQLVSRDVIPNKQAEYSKLSNLLKEGRMSGIVDWEAIEDRLRVPSKPSSFDSPADILETAVNQYMLPRMQGQKNYIEVWVEKDALSGVLKRVTQPYHVPIMVNRGYSSASAMYDAYRRFLRAHEESEQPIRILYLGDFDPSGVDMIRDIKNRIMEMGTNKQFDFRVKPIALTREQIDEYRPPPNPAKTTDPRAGKFIAKHGYTSWEVDALRPEVLMQVLRNEIEKLISKQLYQQVLKQEEKDKDRLKKLVSYL